MNNNNRRIQGKEIQMGDSFVLPIEQSRVTMSQAKVKQILEETDAKAQELLSNAENKSQIIIQTANTEATRIKQHRQR